MRPDAQLNADRHLLLDRYSLSDLARKVVGVGSVGTRCLVALFECGDDDASDRRITRFAEAGRAGGGTPPNRREWLMRLRWRVDMLVTPRRRAV